MASTTTPWQIGKKPGTPNTPTGPKLRMFNNADQKVAQQAQKIGDAIVKFRGDCLSSDYASIERDAIDRLYKEFHVYETAVSLLKQIVQRLQSSELTINFNAMDWFKKPNNYDSYTQMYERKYFGGFGTAESPVFRWLVKGNKDNPLEVREANERFKMIAPAAKHNAEIAKFADTGKSLDTAVGVTATGMPKGPATFKPLASQKNNSVSSFSTAENSNFNAMARPRYAALNFGKSRFGAAMSYGKSHLVLKDSLKTKATFCPKDSFETCVQGHMFCTYQTMAALVLWADDGMFKKLVRAVHLNQHYTADKGDGSGNHIVEAHIFSPILFKQDLQCLRICKDEAGGDWNTVENNAAEFAKKNSVKLEIF